MDVAVSALRAELKTWIERARAGEDVVITDRGVPVARLTSVKSTELVTDLMRDGVLTAPAESRVELVAGHDSASADEVDQRGGVSGLVRRLRR